jgi:hypothetical protein
MTVFENLKTIKNKKIRNQAIHNILIQHNRTLYDRKIDMYKSADLYSSIFEFIWADTIEDHDYWEKIFYKDNL